MQKVNKKELFDILSLRHENSEFSRLSHLPNPNTFKDIKKATQRVIEAIVNNETITIVGDYDVDGVVSTTIMLDFFNKLLYKVNHIIPNRFTHGYGLSPKIVELINSGLVITVDNGIGAVQATKLLNDKNIDVIITDHHTVGSEIPEAYAIINPKQKDCPFIFKDICGAQVAWYFCASIKNAMNKNINMGDFLDLLCIAIIADIMPMTSLNYTMVKIGLKKIKTSQRPALVQLQSIMRKEKFVSDDIGFFIAPKINSAGRMEDASLAVNFLLAKNSYEAQKTLEVLDDLNNLRKTVQEEITLKAKQECKEEDKASIVWGEDWHEGVIGIVASKLAHLYKKPAFVFSISKGIAKGSARANGDINLHTIISQAKDLLIGFGGHKNAAGLSLKVENLGAFKTLINKTLDNDTYTLHLEPKTLGELDISSVDIEFLDLIEKYEPYGLENEKPIFKITNAKLIRCELFGRDKNHLKLILNHDGNIFEALKFYCEDIYKEEKISIIISVSKNIFRGETKAQFLIQDIL